MRSGIARTSHAPYLLRPGHPMLLEPTSSKLHCPGSRLDRRLGPAATHFGNRRFQTIRPVGADQVTSRHALSGYNSHGTRSNHLPLPSRLVLYSSQTDNYLEVALSTKDLTRSQWLDVCSRPVLLCSPSALADDTDRPPYATTQSQVPQSQSWCCRQHSSTNIHMPPNHPSGALAHPPVILCDGQQVSLQARPHGSVQQLVPSMLLSHRLTIQRHPDAPRVCNLSNRKLRYRCLAERPKKHGPDRCAPK